jgi:hypothetical protein
MSTPSTSSKFPDKNELKRFARYFVKERIDSLQKDAIAQTLFVHLQTVSVLLCQNTPLHLRLFLTQ